jgi:hypothetical protein
VVLAVGAAVMVAGTFAPWLRSGRVTRNSYRTAGLLERLLDVHGLAGAALDAMPLLALLCAICAVVFIAGYRRVAVTAISLLAVVMGVLAIAVLNAPSADGIRAVHTGPIVTLAGSLAALLAAAVSVLARDADRARGSR